jgi:hypothetical protein
LPIGAHRARVPGLTISLLFAREVPLSILPSAPELKAAL